jgi:hypothetical protein
MQKLEVKNALDTLNSAVDGIDNNVDMESIMGVDTAFHCVPVEGQEGEYALLPTDMTMNSQRGDGLEPDLPPPIDDSSNADTRNLLSQMDDAESSKADTRKIPAKPAAKKRFRLRRGKLQPKRRKSLLKEGLPVLISGRSRLMSTRRKERLKR